MAEGFVFYQSFAEALEIIPADQYGKAARAIIRYALYDEIPEALEAASNIVFIMAKPQIDANTRRRENGKKGAKYGIEGGRPPKNPIGDNEENPIGVTQETPKANTTKAFAVISETPKETVTAKVKVTKTKKGTVESKKGGLEGREKTNTPASAPLKVDVLNYFVGCGASEAMAISFFEYFQSKGWKTKSGADIKDWQFQAQLWIQTGGKI